ncbi:hypothetical protein [Paenibacillus sp. FSL L8-0323]|uniref:BC1872 family protein n=1 Tax=unclassified Paenibacillus TaxID=185978 RepID=UPI0030F961AC
MTLTRKEILAKKPGKELNEHVMRHIFNMKKDPEGASFTWVHEVDGDIVDWQPAYFSPSTNMSAAWEVVEKMRQNKIYMDIRVWPDEYQVLPHQDENNKLIDRWIVRSPSLPEAICKAALLAVLNL